jgi:DNA-binding transcriptional regulator YiaG
MGLKDTLLKLLRKKEKQATKQALQSGFKSIESDTSIARERKPVKLYKDSLELGLAAGFVSRSIREIEKSLLRIESHMVTRDWFKTEFEDKTPDLEEILQSIHSMLKEHEAKEEQRFKAIQTCLDGISRIAHQAPQHIREELLKEVRMIESHLPLTSKMKQLISTIREAKQISYDDLAAKLNISVSALRGLLSNTLKRTNEIERYAVDRKGWVRYRGETL